MIHKYLKNHLIHSSDNVEIYHVKRSRGYFNSLCKHLIRTSEYGHEMFNFDKHKIIDEILYIKIFKKVVVFFDNAVMLSSDEKNSSVFNYPIGNPNKLTDFLDLIKPISLLLYFKDLGGIIAKQIDYRNQHVSYYERLYMSKPYDNDHFLGMDGDIYEININDLLRTPTLVSLRYVKKVKFTGSEEFYGCVFEDELFESLNTVENKEILSKISHVYIDNERYHKNTEFIELLVKLGVRRKNITSRVPQTIFPSRHTQIPKYKPHIYTIDHLNLI